MSDERFGLVAGRYLLRSRLGHGGMGRVWLARDEMLERDVAIKEVAPPTELSAEEGELLRALILREARAAGRINHPHVVKIYDVIQTELWPWLVMEYIPSVTLQKAVESDGAMSPVEVAKIGLDVLEALTAAHEAGVLHRDVKPDNVLLCDDGRVVLSDFGLATLDTDGKVTRTGQLGTPQYVAPERARHGISSREADMWSLGATLYAAVEGRSPYGRESVLETLSALAIDDPDPMRRAGPLEPVLAGLLRRDPAERTGPERLAEQLRQVVAGDAVTPLPVRETPPRPDRISAKTVAAGLGALVVTVAAGLALTAGDHVVPRGIGTETATAPATGLAACDAVPAVSNAVPTDVPPPPGELPLLAGWDWFINVKDFRTGVPKSWRYWFSGDTVCFGDPNSTRVLAVIKGTPALETLPGYRLVAREEIYRAEPEVEWEFTYAGRG
ncbi:MAG TPA: serine/threonine protein kinase, partial [Micromonosporaceae bacterium]|nr:serine/threonine protein kinase [Micromonosporaceae bacterium]